MQRLICEACRTPPAASARAGDSCARCRGALQLHTRCPWCTGWAREPMCGACSAELLSPHDFGAARMLVEGGVDRYALPERVRALPRHQHAELSARFDAQWSALRIRIEEARGVDRFLLTRGLASTIEDLLIARIPLAPGVVRDLTAEPRPPFDDIERLRDIADRSPLEPTRVMASIALVHARRATRQDMEAARRALRHADGVFADEAALALGRWWVWSIDRGCADAVRERAAALLSDAELGPWAAVSAARVAVSDDERAQLEPGLRAALASRNQDLRFAAALALGDEAGLIAARSAADDVMRARALRALASVGSMSVAGDLATGSDEVRGEILRGLTAPLARELLEALLAALAGAGPALQRDLFGFLRSRCFATLVADERAVLADWIGRAGCRSLPLSLLLDLLAWATEPVGDHPRDDAEVQPFVAAATSALSSAGAEQRESACREQRFELGRWLYAAPAPDAAPVLDVWARDPAAGVALLQQIIQLHAHLNGWGRVADDRALAHFFGLLDRVPADEALAHAVARALRAESGASGREKIVEGLWRRFVASPERRRAIAIAVEPMRQVMTELRRAEGATGELWPARDPARFFAVLAGADPLHAPYLAREAAEAAEEAGRCPPADLVDAVMAQIEPELTGRPCTALWTLANVASPVANRFRELPHDAGAAAAVAALRRGWARLSPRLWALSPIDDKEARYQHLVEQIETELRLIAEKQEQLVEDRRREAEREAARATAEVARLAAERHAADCLERARLDRERLERELLEREESRRLDRESSEARGTPPPDLTRSPWRDPGVDEPILPDQPLSSLAAFARFLCALRVSRDALTLLRSHEISPEAWSACAQAWSQLLASRPDLALRLSQLCAAPDPSDRSSPQ